MDMMMMSNRTEAWASLVAPDIPSKIVHLDLKGAPPKLLYLEKFLQLCKYWGATGILVEWEDTFPYTANLMDIGSQTGVGDGLYTMDDVQIIFKMARELNLEVIQLVQTIGHMEFVLKHPAFQHLREVPKTPSALCPTKVESQHLVRAMVDQVLAVQPDARYLHIGADEVWHLGECDDCKARAETLGPDTTKIYLEHIRNLAMYIHEKRPNLKILIWDDMLRMIAPNILKEYLGSMVEPVVWNYNEKNSFRVPVGLWMRYKEAFTCVWVGSAYKGADGSRQMEVSTERYISNQEAWIREVGFHWPHVDFAGIILTGWSRFDHFATLCELLPLGLPSLSHCLKRLQNVYKPSGIQDDYLPGNEWPGCELALAVKKFRILSDKCKSFLKGDLIGTWLNPWQLQHNYTNCGHAGGIAVTIQQFLTEMLQLERTIRTQLATLTGPRSADEWLGTNVTPLQTALQRVYEQADAQATLPTSVRPTY